jgi:hypothetical protein
MKPLLALLLAANVLAPSGILGRPAQFDRQKVTVLGIVGAFSVRQVQNVTISQFSLCDSRCINVVEFNEPPVAIGKSLTVSGTFHTIFSNGIIQARNVVMVDQP